MKSWFGALFPLLSAAACSSPGASLETSASTSSSGAASSGSSSTGAGGASTTGAGGSGGAAIVASSVASSVSASSSSGAGGGATGWQATPPWTNLPNPIDSHPAMVAHPANAGSFGILASSFQGNPPTSALDFATTSNLATSFQTFELDAPPSGSEVQSLGLGWTGTVLAAFVLVQGSSSTWTLSVSTDGGQSFSPSSLLAGQGTPPAAGMAVGGGKTPELVFRHGAELIYSADGVTSTATRSFGSCTDSSPTGGGFDVDPNDHSVALLRCDGAGLSRCQSGACTASTGPTALASVLDVRFSPDGANVVAVAADNAGYVALHSTDGGASFAATQTFADNVSPSWRVAWDPRAGKSTAYALLVDHLFRSMDGGATWTDVTPPPSLNIIYDVIVLADGTVVAQGVFHYLVLPPT